MTDFNQHLYKLPATNVYLGFANLTRVDIFDTTIEKAFEARFGKGVFHIAYEVSNSGKPHIHFILCSKLGINSIKNFLVQTWPTLKRITNSGRGGEHKYTVKLYQDADGVCQYEDQDYPDYGIDYILKDTFNEGNSPAWSHSMFEEHSITKQVLRYHSWQEQKPAEKKFVKKKKDAPINDALDEYLHSHPEHPFKKPFEDKLDADRLRQVIMRFFHTHPQGRRTNSIVNSCANAFLRYIPYYEFNFTKIDKNSPTPGELDLEQQILAKLSNSLRIFS